MCFLYLGSFAETKLGLDSGQLRLPVVFWRGLYQTGPTRIDGDYLLAHLHCTVRPAPGPAPAPAEFLPAPSPGNILGPKVSNTMFKFKIQQKFKNHYFLLKCLP